MSQAEVLELLLSELEEAVGPLATAFASIAAETAGSEALREAIDIASLQIDCIRAAAEACGLLGLEVICDRLRDNILQLADTNQQHRAALDELLLLWPERVMEYLLQPGAEPNQQALAQLLHQASWPLPFTDHELELVLELLAATSGSDDNQIEERSQDVDQEDVSLIPADDVHVEVLEAFLDDAPLQTAALAQHIHELASTPDLASTLDQARRLAHTLKGAAAVAGVAGITNLTHHLEDLFEYLAKIRRRPGQALMDSLAEAADCLEAMTDALTGVDSPPANALPVLRSILQWAQLMDRGELEALDGDPVAAVSSPSLQSADAPEPTPEELTPATSVGVQSLRVPVPTIESLYRQTGELSIAGAQLAEGLARVQQLQHALTEQDKVMQQRLFELEDLIDIQDITSTSYRLHSNQAGQADFDPLEMDQYNELHGCSRALTEAASDWRELNLNLHDELARLRNMLNQQSRLHQELEDSVLSTRLVPVHSIASRLQRFVRQACRATGKLAELEILGDDLALDTELLQALVDPLGHLLRNAVDHGIETPSERLVAGKEETGQIRLSFQRDGNFIQIICNDDGRGFDLAAIQQRAINRDLLSADESVDTATLSNLLLLPGFSTRDQVTHTSGRGIGLDVVHAGIRAMNGSLSLSTTAGAGATFTLRLPTALVTVHVLLVEAGGQTIALPSSDLVHVPAPGSWQRVQDGEDLRCQIDEIHYPLRPLAAAMGRAIPDSDITPPVLLARVTGEVYALEVERLIGSTQVVIKHFGDKLPQVRGVLGAAILGDGAVAPVLDLAGLMQAPVIDAPLLDAAQAPALKLPDVLVVDDSLSMRRALSQFLQDSGFQVRLARDGIEAIRAVEEQQPDLLIVDLEMPRMNGLELTAHLRDRSTSQNLPIIMLTSRSMQKHRQQADLAGVNAYLTKPFQEAEMLETIESILPALAAD